MIEDDKEKRQEAQKLQEVRPFIKVIPKSQNTEIEIYFARKDSWLKYVDVYFDFDHYYHGGLPNPSHHDKDICHQQMGEVAVNKIKIKAVKKTDSNFRFLIDAKTILNEQIYIYHFDGYPDTYLFDPIPIKDLNHFYADDGYQKENSFNTLHYPKLKGKILKFSEQIENKKKNKDKDKGIIDLDEKGYPVRTTDEGMTTNQTTIASKK
ncbi:hypothetical protein [Oenococcus oeni]|nr:hypothetical protein [Oenococcus oeni]